VASQYGGSGAGGVRGGGGYVGGGGVGGRGSRVSGSREQGERVAGARVSASDLAKLPGPTLSLTPRDRIRPNLSVWSRHSSCARSSGKT
jgi:hypothetical protein